MWRRDERSISKANYGEADVLFAFADAVVRTDSGTRRKFKQIDAVEGAVDGLNQNSVSCAPCSRQKETDLSN